ncbi:uncharacterized protein LOC130436457 isoform X2 [Triplophysa dalaica]|uniref:uncharacterized protein LOC130436457 isoform X2 n=1 Tax=Triplophysa dalaica TaxID=1582913 RepID=UPI0024DFB4D6|nr:uncharacterized protein LOC130436457 isoform X2 [Triplophysa dalaica]
MSCLFKFAIHKSFIVAYSIAISGALLKYFAASSATGHPSKTISFSKLKLVYSYLSSTMSQEQLTGLAIISINHSIGGRFSMMTLLMILHQGRPESDGERNGQPAHGLWSVPARAQLSSSYIRVRLPQSFSQLDLLVHISPFTFNNTVVLDRFRTTSYSHLSTFRTALILRGIDSTRC